MKWIVLIVGCLLAILFMAFLRAGRKYDGFVQALDEQSYPLKDLYGVGFLWGSFIPLERFPKQKSKLMNDAQLLYDAQYAEFYATTFWAQMFTFVHLFLAITFLVAAMLWTSAGIILAAGGFLAILAGGYSLTNPGDMLKTRMTACEDQLPEVVSTMAILTNAGMLLRDAWREVAEAGRGDIYELMRKAEENMKNGMAEKTAIDRFGVDTGSPEVKKFTIALISTIDRGGMELPGFLAQESSELWHTKKQAALQEGEKAATKLLAPIMMIFMGIILIIISAALAGTLF